MGQVDQSDRLGQAEAATQKGLTWDFYDLDFSVQRSRRYHEKLCAFYGTWRDWIKTVSVIAGSGIFVLLIVAKASYFAEIVAAFVALWAILDYVIEPAKKADKHCDLGQKFTDLAILIARSPRSEECLGDLQARRLEIEKMEPPCKRLVDLQARNDECRARGLPPDEQVPLSWAQRYFGYFVTFGMQRLEKWKSDRQRQAQVPT
jgi:hypothetical protein